MDGLGEEIYRARDEHGLILVYQKGELRTLSFGTKDEQSGMLLSRPERLEYAYTQAMMLALILAPEAQRLAVLGLGGGSLVRALLHAQPQGLITAVESRAQVARVAREFFSLPSNPRLRVEIEDAGRYIRRQGDSLDIIFLDLFHGRGMDAQQTETGFLRRCRERLGPGGLLVVNLWNTDYRDSRRNRESLLEAFEGRLLQITVAGGNNIVFAFSGAIPSPHRRLFFTSAQSLGSALGIPLQRLARNLWFQNSALLQYGRTCEEP